MSKKRTYSDLTAEGREAVLYEARRNGCEVEYDGGRITVKGGHGRRCAEALAYDYEGGIYSDSARRFY